MLTLFLGITRIELLFPVFPVMQVIEEITEIPDLPDRVRSALEAAKAKKISQTAIAQALGCSRQHLLNIIGGKVKTIDRASLNTLSEVTGVQIG